MKRYLIIRWKRRWPIVPLSMGWGVLMHFMAPALQRPSHPIGEILLPLGFCLVVVLFPFQWSGETRDGLWKE